MSNHHLQLALSVALPGMVLSDDVLDTKGNVLLPQGAVLTTSILSSLQRHEIASVAVVGEERSVQERNVQLRRVHDLFRQPGVVPGTLAIGNMTTATALLQQYVLHFRSGTHHE